MRGLSVEFTTQCNYRCPWCINRKLLEEEHKVTSPTEFERIMLWAKKNKIDKFAISGGEPLCRPRELLSAVYQIRQMSSSIQIAVATNGTGLTERIADFFNRINVSVVLSVEARGYKSVDMLIKNALEPDRVLRSLNSLSTLKIRTVRPAIKDFAKDTLLLHALFPNREVVLTPDCAQFEQYTLSDIALFRKELEYLACLSSDVQNWLSIQGVHREQCTGEIYRYSIATQEILRVCALEKTCGVGCMRFRTRMKPEVFDAYDNCVKEILYRGENYV